MPKLTPKQNTEKTSRLYRQARFLNSTSAETTFELAETLTNLYDSDRHAFVQFYNDQNLGKRKAYYLVEIHRKYVEEMGIDRATMIKVGWTKLMLMLSHISPDNADDYIEYAIGHNVKELSAYIRGEETPKLKQVLFTLSKEQEEIIAPIINQRGKSREENLIDFFKEHLDK